MSSLKALIDGDIVCWRCAASADSESTEEVALWRVNTLIESIIDKLRADEYCIYIGGDTNFRYSIDPEYKAHRKDKPKPKWLQHCREFLVTNWNAVITDGIEADDALGIAQTDETFICSIDKDLLQIPGLHYNFVKDEEYYITEEEGLYNFWMQTLVGDVADNIQGIRGLGPVKAAKILTPIKERELYGEDLENLYYETVASLYNDPDRLHKNCKLLYIHRKENDSWLSPQERNPVKKKRGRPVGSKALLPQCSEQEADAGLQNTKP